MAKNMKSRNSKLAKLFLLGCANAAILAGMPSNAMADITVADIIARKVEFITLAPQAQFANIKNLVASESFKTVPEADRIALKAIVNRDFDPQNTGLGNNALSKEKETLIKNIENAPRERARNNRGGLPMVGMQAHEPAARNLEVGAGFNKPKTAIEENEILNTILKDNDFAALQEQAKNIQIQRRLEIIPANLDRIKTIIVDGLPENFKNAALNNLLNSELSHDEVKHILFKNNFLDKNAREDKKSFEYSEVGNSPLFTEINEMDTVTVKQREDLLKAYKGYVNNNFAAIHSQRPNDVAIKKLVNLMEEERLTKYLTTMTEIKLDSFEKDIDGAKPLGRKALTEYNSLLKEIGVITEDLSNDDMKSLIKGFNTKTMNKLASSLEDTKKEDANKRLVFPVAAPVGAIGAPPPPPPLPGGRIAGGGIPGATAMMANAAFDIKNLTRINGLDAALSNDLSSKLKEFYNLFTEFEKNKGAIQKERNEQKAELARQKEEQKKKREADLLAAEQVYFNGLTEAEKQQYAADKEATQKLAEHYERFYLELHPNKKPEDGDNLTIAAKSEMLLGVQQDIKPIIRMMLTEDIIETQVKPGLQAAIAAGNIDINVLSEQYNDKLSKLFSADSPNRADIEAQVKSTYALLVKDKGLNQRAKNIAANEDFFADLLNEEEGQKAVRLDWVFRSVPESMQEPITKEKVKTATLLELEKIATVIDKIQFIKTKPDILGNDVLNNQVKDIVTKFNDLSLNDKIDLIVNKENVNNKINTVEPQTLNDLNAAKTNWLSDSKNIAQLLANTAINLVDLKTIEKKPEVNVNQLMDFYKILAVTKANLMDSKTDVSSIQISENEITPQVQKAFSKALSSKKEYDKKTIVTLVSRINAKDLLKKFEDFKNQNRIADLDGIKDALDKLKTSEKNLSDKRKEARDAARVAPVVVAVPAVVKEIESDIGKKIKSLMEIAEAEAEAVAANNNAERNAAAEQVRLKTRTQKVINKALALALSKSEIDKAIADNGNCDEQTLGRITKEAERVLDNEYQGDKNELFINMENTLNEQYKVILEDEGLVAFLQENNKDFIEKIQNVVGEVAVVIPVAPAAVVPVNVAAAVPVAPAPVVINAEDREEGLPPVAEGGAEEVEAAPIPAVEVPVVAVIAADPDVAEDVDGGEAQVVVDAPNREEPREEDGEAVERPVIQAPANLGEQVVANEPNFNDSEANFGQEEDKKEEEKQLAAAIQEEVKRAEEARIAEAVRVEAAEVAEMQTAVKADKEMIGAIYNPIHDITQMSRNILSNRIMQTTLSSAAVAAGDEDERVLDKGVWVAGTIGTNKQKGVAGYKGHASGGTIGFDIGFDNFKDLIGIAYTELDSKFKSSGSKLNTTVDSHILALYGQKELPKNFMVQGMFAYNHNIVKSKINRLGTIATGKYKNDNYNFETLLSYNHLMNGGITLAPNIGVRYGHSKDGSYQESDVGIQHLSIASKKQNLWSGILGGSVALAPQKIVEGFSITPALQASVENYFNNKSKKLNAKVKWKDREVNETIALPKQPKVGYNIGASVLTEKGNVSVVLEYNCHLQKKYQSHQGFVKLKVKL